MEPIYIYMLTYIFPIFIMIALATYALMYNNRATENRLIALILLAFCIMLGGEFTRHVSPFSYNPFITLYIVGLTTTFSMAFIIHLEFILIKKHCNLKTHPLVPYLGYLFIPIHAIITLFFIQLSTTDFQKVGIWIYRENFLYNFWIYSVVGFMSAVALFVCLYGWYNSTTEHGKKLLRFLSIGTTIIFISFFVAMLTINVNNMIPNPTMFLIFLTGILFAISITQFEMTPSIHARYQTMFDLTPTSIILLNERLEILEINHQAKSFFYTNDDGLLTSFLNTPTNIRQALRVIKKLRNEKDLHNFQTEFQHPVTCEKITVLIQATLLPFQDVTHFYIMWQDITHEVKQEKLIHHLAFHDVLTGIQNRAYFVNNVKKLLHASPHEKHAFVLIDLNSFKQINDSYGHIVGDAVLQFVAKQLQTLVSTTNIVARLGGDEFVILFENIESGDQVQTALQNIRVHFEQTPFQYEDLSLTISLSIGFSLFPIDGTNFEVLFNIADLNMYDDKAKIKSRNVKKV